MGETFYGVLGVNPDADTATIKQAYREKVKTHHPDVSDESDAAERFQRITEARDVLVDDTDRKRYDRMGHDAYVRRYLDSTAWSATDADGRRTRRRDAQSRTSRSSNDDGRSTRESGQSETRGSNGRRSSRRRRNRTRDDTTRSNERRRYRSRSATDEQSDGRGPTDRAAWMGEDGWSTSGNTAAGGNRRQTRTDGWREQYTASNVYSPTGRDAGVGTDQPRSRYSAMARGIGPWIVFHFVFLVSAFVTMYLLLSWSPTVPTMFGSLLLLGSAIFFSILHMVSRIYS